MKKILIPIFCFLTNSLIGQTNFSVSNIPDNLKQNADAVVRFDDTEFIIENYSKIVTKHHWAVTIFNENGEDNYAMFRADYDKFKKVKKIEGTLYDKSGEQLKKLKNTDIEDVSLNISSEYVSDNRAKIAKFDKKFYPYPYTLEFSYEDESSNTMFYPVWDPIPNEKTAIQNSTFIVKTANDITYRKKEINIKKASTINSDGKFKIEKWEVKDLNLYESEKYSLNNSTPIVFFAPTKYYVDGFSGNANSWNDIANFYYAVNKGRDELPQTTIEKLNDVIKNENNPKVKVKKIYEFMQSQTRYFLVALGIGGWQSIPAYEVGEKGYGDCKALTNFTIALLKHAGIKAYPALIYADDAGKNKFEYEDFPRMMFNHVIACVPFEKDTIWLECTSQTNPTGYLGSFTGNRKALLVKENTGKLINTQNYSSEKNLQKREAKVKFEENGSAIVNIKTTYFGLQQETKTSVLNQLSTSQQKDWLHKNLEIPNFEILAFNLNSEKSDLPKLYEEIELIASRYASFSGNRLFIKPNMLSRFVSNPVETNPRETPLFLNPNYYSFNDEDLLEFEIPDGYKSEFLPKEVNMQKNFGKYSSSSQIIDNKLIYKRSLILKGGEYLIEDYSVWLEFIKAVNKADNQKAVFIKTI
ncbi:DUF3857 domain-containing protein [Lacihabitans sp. LS3-19]|uniref:DUF3857 domain-containing protein n=1 Tax=Lacihabitans sp. LS3-19 TaxID=2487335 RepID=UPI0020CF6D35|nr:DUF3857 domain-containing protein [Lacihabitans sp. LS3-19]MCP9770949.1 DUF3857 domain-containing protein [Lacihabitans sp. LS3-19]